MESIKNSLAIIAGLILVMALGVAAWQFSWFVEAKNVDRRTQVDDKSMGRQQALTSKVLEDIRTVRDIDTQEQTPAVMAQRKAIVSDICSNAALLTGSVTISASAETFINQECI